MSKTDNDGTDHSLPIKALTNLHRVTLEKIGWTVILHSSEGGGDLCLHAMRNGELAKLPTIILAYHPIRFGIEMRGDGKIGRSDVRRMRKPWEVMTRRDGQGGKWKDEVPAVEAFLREAATYP